ncbi:MAG: alkaline phosphatase [Candidatus Muiribacteriota bacterium]
MKKTLTLILLIGILVSSYGQEYSAAQNLIILIADGMSLSNKTLTRIFKTGPYGRLNIDNMDVTGYLTNHSADSWISDSAANSSAVSTGFKTNNSKVSVLPNGDSKSNFFEKISLASKKTGIVSNGPVTSEALSPYYAHADSIKYQSLITEELFRKNINVIMGGGEKTFLPQADGGIRTDGKNMIEESQKQEYRFISTARGLRDFGYSEKILGLFERDYLPYSIDRDEDEVSLYEMSKKALEILKEGEDGFVLLVENYNIQRAFSTLDIKAGVEEIEALDKLAGMFINYIEEDPETLLVILSAFDSGGITVTNSINPHIFNPLKASVSSLSSQITSTGENIEQVMAVQAGININSDEKNTIESNLQTEYVKETIGHIIASRAGISTLHPSRADMKTSTVTPVWVHGHNSELFNGYHDNTEIGKKLIQMLGVE